MRDKTRGKYSLIITDTVEIRANATKIFNWFLHFAENYRAWHPDHVKAEWIKGKPFELGSVLCAEEYLHGELHKIKFRLTKIEPNRLIAYKNLFPFSLLSPSGFFQFEPSGENTLFTAALTFRMGKLLTKLAKTQTELFLKHVKEEGENLKRLLEE